MDTTLTPYELERLENIQKNKILLDDLGINGPKDFMPPKAIPKASASSSKKRGRGANRTSVSYEPPRKSRRLANAQPSALESISGHADPAPPQITLRQLNPPAIPAHIKADQIDLLFRAPLPHRDASMTLRFEVETHFTPNITPAEMISMGSFGGTAFRRVYSKTLQRILLEDDYREFPSSWYEALDVPSLLTREAYAPSINKYGVKAGQSLEEWEAAGWIRPQDPRGWLQWYCRFYLGRRTGDDERQIKRWLGVCGPSGRFKRSLVKKIVHSGSDWDDASVAPVLRQTLQHWGYQLTEADYRAYLSS